MLLKSFDYSKLYIYNFGTILQNNILFYFIIHWNIGGDIFAIVLPKQPLRIERKTDFQFSLFSCSYATEKYYQICQNVIGIFVNIWLLKCK